MKKLFRVGLVVVAGCSSSVDGTAGTGAPPAPSVSSEPAAACPSSYFGTWHAEYTGCESSCAAASPPSGDVTIDDQPPMPWRFNATCATVTATKEICDAVWCENTGVVAEKVGPDELAGGIHFTRTSKVQASNDCQVTCDVRLTR